MWQFRVDTREAGARSLAITHNPTGQRFWAAGPGYYFSFTPLFTAPSWCLSAIYKSTATTSASFKKWRSFENTASPLQHVAWMPNGIYCTRPTCSCNTFRHSHQFTMSRVTKIVRPVRGVASRVTNERRLRQGCNLGVNRIQ